MANEKLLKKIEKVRKDPVLWIETFCKVVNKDNQVVPFILNPQQKEFIRGLKKYNITLKSRQIGITTCAAAYSLYLTLTRPKVTCLLMSYSDDTATGIFQDKLKMLYDLLNPLVKLPNVINNKRELQFTNRSRIVVATCGNKDVARGLSLQFVHLSEAAFMKETIPRQIIAIQQALLPSGQMVLESTANGINYFSDVWNKASLGENDYKTFFFPWQDDKIMFQTEIADAVKEHVDKYGSLLTREELDDKELHLLDYCNCSFEQLIWRRWKIRNSSEQVFMQEFPSHPQEAYQTTGSNVFNVKQVHDAIQVASTFKPLKTRPGGLPKVLSPLFGKELTMWTPPKAGARYFISVDCGEGIGKDYSVVEVFDANLVQMMELRTNIRKAYELAEYVWHIGKYYNTGLIIVESASTGHSLIDKYRDKKSSLKYKNLYYSVSNSSGKRLVKPGFSTDAISKTRMINEFVEMFETGKMIIKSKVLLDEMKYYTINKNGSMGASIGNDDCLMATALNVQAALHGYYYAKRNEVVY